MLKVIKIYGFFGFIRLVFHFIITWIFNRPARLIRLPFYIRGRSNIIWGKGFTTGVGVRLDAFGKGSQPILIIGDNVQLNDYVHIAAIEEVSIGSGTLIASRVFISDHNHGQFHGNSPENGPDVEPAKRPLKSNPVRIGMNVWIGEQVCILPGVTIGDGAVIGAGSIVLRDVPEASVVVGNPARVIRVFDASTQTWKRI